MSSTTSIMSAEVPDAVTQAIESFTEGELSLLEIQQVIAMALEENPARGEAIHVLLDDELKDRRLTIADYGELVGIVGSVVSENVPTEYAEETPEESGVYRVIEEGGMVLAERPIPADPQDGPPPTYEIAAGDGKPESDEHTRPFAGEETASPPEPASPLVAPGLVLRERFRLEEEIARGSMGVVYRATDLLKLEVKAADPFVAVKLVSPEFAGNKAALRAFQNEVANTQHLSHPNIIHLFELDRDGEHFFITMEWLDGESLDALLDRSQGSALPPVQTYAIIEQLCDALTYAHEHNVIHADVKPGNVFLVASGEVKLIDFGIAKTEVDWQNNSTAQEEGAIALTPAYASCERLEKAAPTAQDDLYSLASLIYRLLAGRRVFGPLTALEAEEQAMEAVPIGGMAAERWAALSKALAFRRQDRQETVAEFAREFGRRALPRDGGEEVSTTAADTTRLPTLDSLPDSVMRDLEKAVRDEAAAAEDFASDLAGAHANPELVDVFDDAIASQTQIDVELEGPGPEATADPIAPQGPAAAVETPVWRQKRFIGGALAAGLAVGLVVLFAGGDPEAPLQSTARDTPQRPQPVEPVAGDTELVGAALAVDAGDVPEERADIVTENVVDNISERSDENPAEDPAFERAAAPVAVGTVAVLGDDPEPARGALPEPEPVPLYEDDSLVAATSATGVTALAVAADEPVASIPAEEQAAVAPQAVNDAATVIDAAADAEALAATELLTSLSAAVELTLAEDRLDTPLRDNAIYYLERMQSAAPQADETLGAAALVATALLAQAQLAADAQDFAATERWLNLAAAAGASEESQAELRGVISAENQRLAALAAAEKAAAAKAAAAAEAAALAAAAEPVFDPREPVALSELEFVDYVEPKYPRNLSKSYDGWVDVEFRVGIDGKTRNIEVIGSNLPDRFDAPSMTAVEKWRFKPYLNDGEPVAVYSAVRLRYQN